MLKLSKKTEYAILAMQYLAGNREEPVSAKEIANELSISFEFLSKSLQSLMKYGLVVSQQGIKGGYYLAKSPDEITIMEIIRAVDENIGIVDCLTENDCERSQICYLKDPMAILQSKINSVFTETTVSSLLPNDTFDKKKRLIILNKRF